MILKINDRITTRKIDFFNKFTLGLRFDSVGSTFSFQYYFDPYNFEHKELSCIGHFHKCTIEHEGDLLLTGYVVTPRFKSAPQKQLTGISGYSLPGFLEDCQIPTSLYPLQSDGLTLREIASKLIKPFGITMVVDSAVASRMDEAFDKTTAQATETIKGYLSELASQKNIIVTHNQYGNLVFTEAKTNRKSLIDFNVPKGGIPGTSMELDFNGQSMHSEITVMKQASKKNPNSSEFTVKNPYVPYVFRPRVAVQNSGTDADTERAARNLLAEELKNLKLTITTDRWKVDGKLIKPNNIITVINPEVYLYKKTTWFIEDVSYSGDEKAMTAVMTCVPVEAYNGKPPVYMFKGINTH